MQIIILNYSHTRANKLIKKNINLTITNYNFMDYIKIVKLTKKYTLVILKYVSIVARSLKTNLSESIEKQFDCF